MSGWRIAANIMGAMLGFLVFGAGGCHIDSECSCPAPVSSATIELGCVPTEPPVVKTTGPCSVCPQALPNGMIPEGSGCSVPDNVAYIVLLANGAGTCHVEVTFGSGTTSSVDVDFVSPNRNQHAAGGERVSSPSPQMAATTIRRSESRLRRRARRGAVRLSAPASTMAACLRPRTTLPRGMQRCARHTAIPDTKSPLVSAFPSWHRAESASTPSRRPGGRRCGAAFGRLQG